MRSSPQWRRTNLIFQCCILKAAGFKTTIKLQLLLKTTRNGYRWGQATFCRLSVPKSSRPAHRSVMHEFICKLQIVSFVHAEFLAMRPKNEGESRWWTVHATVRVVWSWFWISPKGDCSCDPRCRSTARSGLLSNSTTPTKTPPRSPSTSTTTSTISSRPTASRSPMHVSVLPCQSRPVRPVHFWGPPRTSRNCSGALWRLQLSSGVQTSFCHLFLDSESLSGNSNPVQTLYFLTVKIYL